MKVAGKVLPLSGIALSLLLLLIKPSGEKTQVRSIDVNALFEIALRKGPMKIDETKEFMRKLTNFVLKYHLKNNKNSEQYGMIYEYVDMSRIGQFDQFVQGEALDTMHDGAWFAAALVNAYRATNDNFYRDSLSKLLLPFYLKMLNHSDKLFSAKYVYVRPEKQKIWENWLKGEWGLREGEKGFVPYWWDDGNSVSLERRYDKNILPPYPCFDFYLHNNIPNPEFRLHGYSLGSSNHMAQDLGVMLLLSWALMKDGKDEASINLSREIAEAAKNLHQCRLNHFGHIPICCVAYSLSNNDLEDIKRVPDPNNPKYFVPNNHYSRALYDFLPNQRYPFPTFADDQQYRYYWGIAKCFGKLVKPLAFKTIYDAYTERLLYRYYFDDAPLPPGINIAEMSHYAQNGRLLDYRSDRAFGGRPRPFGSRMGPQNMICCGWALQILRVYPGIWEEPYKTQYAADYLRVYIHDPPPNNPNIPQKLAVIKFDELTLRLIGKRLSFIVEGETTKEFISIKLFSRPGAVGDYAVISMRRDGSLNATNSFNELLKVMHEIKPTANGFRFRFEIPYTIAKNQNLWLNGIEHGRYSVKVGDKVVNFYLASDEEQVISWLEWELGYGLRVWEEIFNEIGYIPCEIDGRDIFERFSDSGGYAHLISACAQWILYLSDKCDWKIHGFENN
ncbi:MAG: hypothetical protein NZ781_08145 [Armatimonadetes bacterium]|nr:hypothetical protein [Armatimonadota bacterium]